mgnify:CR=1 FL=1
MQIQEKKEQKNDRREGRKMVKEIIEKLDKKGMPYLVSYFKTLYSDSIVQDFQIENVEGRAYWVGMYQGENPPRHTFAVIFTLKGKRSKRAKFKIEEWKVINEKTHKRSYTLLYDGKHWKEIYEKGSRSTKKSVEWMN